MEYSLSEKNKIIKFDPEDLFLGNSKLNLFDYTQEEYQLFSNGFDTSTIKMMLDNVSRALTQDFSNTMLGSRRVEHLIDYIHTLSDSDLERFQKMVNSFEKVNTDMLWNMLHPQDKKFYKKPNLFYNWLATISDEKLDEYIYRAVGGEKLHPSDMYIKEPQTKVEFIDGFIAISSSNLKALDRFRDRVLKPNIDCKYEHRIKTCEGVKIHSYVFDMSSISD